MSAVQIIVQGDGSVELVDLAFSAEEASEEFDRWRCAHELCLDGERGQNLAQEALQKASDDLREVCAPRFADLDEFEAFLIRGYNALRKARQVAS